MIDEQIKCVAREIRMREKVYPRWIEQGKMSQDKADSEIRVMREVLATLETLAKQNELPL